MRALNADFAASCLAVWSCAACHQSDLHCSLLLVQAGGAERSASSCSSFKQKRPQLVAQMHNAQPTSDHNVQQTAALGAGQV